MSNFFCQSHICIADLASHTFVVSLSASPTPPPDGENGRPLNARIESRFHRLRSISRQHPHVCQYLDLQSGHRARLLLVTEHYTNSLHARREEMCVDHKRSYTKQVTVFKSNEQAFSKRLSRFPQSSLSSVFCPPAFFEFRFSHYLSLT